MVFDKKNIVNYKKYVLSLGQRHFYHMVTPSPWPLFMATQVFIMLVGGVMYMHLYIGGGYVMVWGMLNAIYVVSLWIRDVIREGTYEGMHSKIVQKNLKTGFALFIVSEVMFFFGFFWSFFHSSLAPAVEIGCIWPPVGITPIYPWHLPLLNTCLLLLSGVYITICHAHMRIGKTSVGAPYSNEKDTLKYFQYTLICGTIFTLVQLYEYINAPFTIADGVYGSTFFMLTGFHGLHVFLGSVFILACYIRTIRQHFTSNHHVGFECAAWYWHFVDVVWLFLFVFVYVWSSWGFYIS